jgi:hypothetical protein
MGTHKKEKRSGRKSRISGWARIFSLDTWEFRTSRSLSFCDTCSFKPWQLRACIEWQHRVCNPRACAFNQCA